MIKLEKNLISIPESLIPAYQDLFPGRQSIPLLARTTHEKRVIIINNGSYIDETSFNNRYKKDDVRIALNNIYKSKCAFCESKIEQYHIEHYRPKMIYYWLAFSWDNLIMACATCNQNKGTNFELLGQQAQFDNTEANIKNINNLSSGYDQTESPKMINPESTDPLGKISFFQNGVIESNDVNFAYTIEKCGIDRKWLNDERRRLLDIFRRDLKSALVENKELAAQKGEIATILRKFVRDSLDEELEYLAFRRFSISSGWLNDIAKQLN
jgi:uncharacterized protein (TIGR02646 family)